MDFGSKSLSHPLLVEAAEDLFVPVCIYNNVPGADAEVLKQYGEPAWNNPVVRYVDGKERDVIERKDGQWTAASLAQRMVLALEAGQQEVPDYLRLVHEEASAKRISRATFAMHCFWEGEARLGALVGVRATRAAFLEGKEVVEVEFDEARLSYASLLRSALELDCANKVFARTDQQAETARALDRVPVKRTDEEVRPAKDSDQVHGLLRSPYRAVPMTPMQRTRVNALVAKGQSPDAVLSPRQQALAERLEALQRKDSRALEDLRPPSGGRQWLEYVARLQSED